MKWIDRLLFWALGIVLLAQRPVDAVSVVVLVAAFILACLSEAFKNRISTIIIFVAGTVLSFLTPVFTFFWPLLGYDIGTRKMYPLAALPVISFIFNAAYYQNAELGIVIAATAIAAILGWRAGRQEQLEQQVREVRDTSAETNLLLSERNRQLIAEQEYEIRIATLTERARIAREIHDNVGHMLTRALLQTGAAIATAKDEAAMQSLKEINGTLTDAMNNVRQSVHDLKDESFDLRAAIQGCIDEFNYTCNLNFDLPPTAPRNTQYCFAAVVREAFANVQRHSDATRIHIDVQEHPAFYRLLFRDNGTTPYDPAQNGSGMGLENMRERAKALGGRFTLVTENGFGILITVPKGKE